VKTIPIILLLLTLSAFAKPEFSPRPGTPDYIGTTATTNQGITPRYIQPAVTVSPVAPVPTTASETIVMAPAKQKAVTQAVSQAVSQSVSQPGFPCGHPGGDSSRRAQSGSGRARSSADNSSAGPPVIGQPAPPQMPASMRKSAPGGAFSVIKTGTTNPPVAAPTAGVAMRPAGGSGNGELQQLRTGDRDGSITFGRTRARYYARPRGGSMRRST